MQMTERTNTIGRLRAPLMAAGAMLALSGCAASHVGENWQCPLAQGSQCTSVSAADPAVKDAANTERPARPAPLYRTEEAAGSASDGKTANDCGRSCDPFAWIGRLVAGGKPDNADRGIDAAGVGGTEVSSPKSASSAGTAAAEPLQADMQAGSKAAVDDDPADGLRAPETIGRIWIAPHVGADGVYREGSYVRIVIAPAGWRLP